jgi:medium-chain acyl-[acyl-carrier-protein] hydrolase
MSGLWLARPVPRPAADWKLYCFPWSGAGAGVFWNWSRLTGKNIDVCSVTYPGRERRFSEPPLHSVEAIADGVVPELLDDIDRPYALFGHSLGALVAHACARRLADRGRGPAWVFASGSPPPGTPHREPRRDLSDRDFLRAIAAALDSPDAMLTDPDFAAMILPTLRADIRAAEIYALTAGAGLDCPVTTFGGTRDPRATPSDMRKWQPLAAGGFASEVIDGDHMFVTGSGATMVASVIAATLEPIPIRAAVSSRNGSAP